MSTARRKTNSRPIATISTFPEVVRQSVPEKSIEDLTNALYDARLTIGAIQSTASQFLVKEMIEEDGFFHQYGEESFKRFKDCIEAIFCDELYSQIQSQAKKIARDKLEEAKVNADMEMEERLTLLDAGYFDEYTTKDEEGVS